MALNLSDSVQTPSAGDAYALLVDEAAHLPSGGDLARYLGLGLLATVLVVDCLSMDAPVLEQGTGVQGVVSVLPGTAEFLVLEARTAVEQIQDLQAALGLNKTELAAVLGVTRPTIYEWLGGQEPSATNSTRLARILRALRRAGVSGARPLNARFVRAPREDGATLLSALGAETLDESAVARMLRETREQGDTAERARLARETGRRERGYEAPTVDERRESLAGIVAELPWPKG